MRRQTTGRAILNGLMLVLVLVVNGMAGSGALSGRSIGDIAVDYPTYFLPAGYVFSIWGLIYLLLTGFVVYQATPAGRSDPSVGRVGTSWLINGALNMAWLVAFSYGQFVLAWVVMLGLLLSLLWIEINVSGQAEGPIARWLVALPFQVYLAWVSVATIANTSQLLRYLGWDGGAFWSVIMMAVATALALAMLVRRSAFVFPLVVAWALAGIAIRYAAVPLLVYAAWGFVAVCLGGLAWMGTHRARPA
ncbi:MAG: hypothetical protein R2834_22705 [Rhodothermales bacterium]